MLKDFDSPLDINIDLYKYGLIADKEFLEEALKYLDENQQLSATFLSKIW